MKIIKIKPKPDCIACHGCGEVEGYASYWGVSILVSVLCNCVDERIPEGEEDAQVELDLTDYRNRAIESE